MPEKPHRRARYRPPLHGGRAPLVRTAAPNAAVRRSGSTQRPALSESAGLASHLQWIGMGLGHPRSSRRPEAVAMRCERIGPGEFPAGMNAGVQGGRDSPRGPVIARLAAFRRITSGNLAKAWVAPLRLCVFAFSSGSVSASSAGNQRLWPGFLRLCVGSVSCRGQSTKPEILRLGRFSPSLRMTFRLGCQGQPVVMSSALSAVSPVGIV